ncbi:MAG: hypothetical protein GVY33_09015 [Alphaproteobacteria bacterium]|jgi:hypothetical protein|nr:hypothetical protein [Alphaproteobacteria bacterium]
MTDPEDGVLTFDPAMRTLAGKKGVVLGVATAALATPAGHLVTGNTIHSEAATTSWADGPGRRRGTWR